MDCTPLRELLALSSCSERWAKCFDDFLADREPMGVSPERLARWILEIVETLDNDPAEYLDMLEKLRYIANARPKRPLPRGSMSLDVGPTNGAPKAKASDVSSRRATRPR